MKKQQKLLGVESTGTLERMGRNGERDRERDTERQRQPKTDRQTNRERV